MPQYGGQPGSCHATGQHRRASQSSWRRQGGWGSAAQLVQPAESRPDKAATAATAQPAWARSPVLPRPGELDSATGSSQRRELGAASRLPATHSGLGVGAGLPTTRRARRGSRVSHNTADVAQRPSFPQHRRPGAVAGLRATQRARRSSWASRNGADLARRLGPPRGGGPRRSGWIPVSQPDSGSAVSSMVRPVPWCGRFRGAVSFRRCGVPGLCRGGRRVSTSSRGFGGGP
jgi:hypothetical protein